MFAAEQGNAAAAKLLVESGASVTAINRVSYTALHVAAEAGQAAVVGCLVSAGADVEAVDRVRLTCAQNGTTCLCLLQSHPLPLFPPLHSLVRLRSWSHPATATTALCCSCWTLAPTLRPRTGYDSMLQGTPPCCCVLEFTRMFTPCPAASPPPCSLAAPP